MYVIQPKYKNGALTPPRYSHITLVLIHSSMLISQATQIEKLMEYGLNNHNVMAQHSHNIKAHIPLWVYMVQSEINKQ